MSTSKDERKFTDVVQSIKGAEDDVDKVLEAARLLRHEGESRKLSAEQKVDLIETAIFAAVALGVLVWLFLLFYIAR